MKRATRMQTTASLPRQIMNSVRMKRKDGIRTDQSLIKAKGTADAERSGLFLSKECIAD